MMCLVDDGSGLREGGGGLPLMKERWVCIDIYAFLPRCTVRIAVLVEISFAFTRSFAFGRRLDPISLVSSDGATKYLVV
jgi:hypothetical protein